MRPFPFLFALALAAPLHAADLAAPGMGMTQWQWSCLSDLDAAKAQRPRLSPARLPASAPSRLASPAPAFPSPSPPPLDPSVIAKALPAGPQEARWLLKDGSSWRGVPVSEYVERLGPHGMELYFVAPVAAEELSERLASGSPFSPSQAESALPRRDPLSPSQTRRLLAPLSPAPALANSRHASSHVGCFGLRVPGAHPALRVRAAG